MRTTRRHPYRQLAVVAVVALAATACGGSDTDAADPDEAGSATSADSGSDADESSSPPGDDPAAAGEASATVAGTSLEFPDVVECEIDGETWGEGWRRLLAWSADGHDLLDITVGNEESSSLGAPSSVSITIGTQNPNTLDEANPEQEWSSLFGDGTPVAAELAPDGATGTASVGQASGGDPETAEWSFTC